MRAISSGGMLVAPVQYFRKFFCPTNNIVIAISARFHTGIFGGEGEHKPMLQ